MYAVTETANEVMDGGYEGPVGVGCDHTVPRQIS